MAARRAVAPAVPPAVVPTLVTVANPISFDKLTENATASQIKNWANGIVSVFAQLNTNEVSVDLYMNDQMRLRVSMAVFSDMPLPVAYDKTEKWWHKIKRGNDQREVGTLSWLLSKISGVLDNDIERDIKKTLVNHIDSLRPPPNWMDRDVWYARLAEVYSMVCDAKTMGQLNGIRRGKLRRLLNGF
jgi:hypothetical protein